MSFDVRIKVVVSKADEYRAKAVECDQRAASARTQAQFQELARQWKELAKQDDRNVRVGLDGYRA
jgi:hypothetical protein